HHHLVCSQCGTAVEIEADSTIEQWARNIATDHGFTLTGHDIELYGTCGKCTAKAQQAAHQE
ncbi:MAG: transcriptional repressor, partial [Cutibacterium granulosum]|nr:transcriptional repressor [Cutibacterium granulosum]